MALKKSIKQGRSTISFNLQKHKKTAVNGIGRHNERQPGQKHSNQKIDDTKTPDNVTLIGDGGQTSYTQRIDKIIDEHYKSERKIRKDAVLLVGATIQLGGSVKEYNQDEQVELLTQMSEWLKQEFPHVVSATIHVDETTPHLHYDFVPLTKDGRLSAKVITGQTQLRRYQEACLKYAQEHFPRAGFERQPDEKKVMNGMKQEQFEQYTAWKKQEEDEIRQAWDELDEREEQLDEREKALISRSDALDTQEGEIDRAKQKIDERAREVAQSEQVIESKVEELKKSSVKNANDREQLTAIAKDLAQKLEDIDKREQALIMNEQRLSEREKEQDEREKALEEKERKLNEMLKAMKDAITSMGSALYRRAHEVFFRQTRTMEQVNRDVIMADESKQDEMLIQGAETVVKIGIDNDIKPVEKVVKTVDKINEPKDLQELDWSELIGDLQKQTPVKQTHVKASESEHPQHGWR